MSFVRCLNCRQPVEMSRFSEDGTAVFDFKCQNCNDHVYKRFGEYSPREYYQEFIEQFEAIKVDRTSSIANLVCHQAKIRLRFDSDGDCEDEGAAEFHAEIQSVIDEIIRNPRLDYDGSIVRAANHVGMFNLLIWEQA